MDEAERLAQVVADPDPAEHEVVVDLEQLVARGLPAADVDRVISLVDVAEYKRRQQPPGIKVTSRAFGRDRRVPITNRYGG